MGTLTLALIIGLAIGLILSIWQAIRIYTGANTKIIRNLDRSVYRPVATIIGFFVLWSLVFFVIALIVVSIIKWIK